MPDEIAVLIRQKTGGKKRPMPDGKLEQFQAGGGELVLGVRRFVFTPEG
jgi:hypothetical protein